MEQFANQVAIVTGGASGIGKSICVYLARHGAKVIVADRNLEGARDIETLIAANGEHGQAVSIDVSSPQDWESLIEETIRFHGRIDYLFNNAGIGINGEFQDFSLEQWKRVLDVNLWGVVYGCHYSYPVMIKQGFGHIVNTASLFGLIPGFLNTSYSASKHAVVGFSLTLRTEAKQYGIKVSALCPGNLKTNIHTTTPNASEFLNSEKNQKMGAAMKAPTPEECIDQIMGDVKKNKGIIITPGKHRTYWWMHRAIPELVPIIFTRMIKTMKAQAYSS